MVEGEYASLGIDLELAFSKRFELKFCGGSGILEPWNPGRALEGEGLFQFPLFQATPLHWLWNVGELDHVTDLTCRFRDSAMEENNRGVGITAG